MPTHNHMVNAVSSAGNKTAPEGNLIANHQGLDNDLSDADSNVQMNESMIENAGAGLAHENRQPSLVVTKIICVCGEIPRRKKNC